MTLKQLLEYARESETGRIALTTSFLKDMGSGVREDKLAFTDEESKVSGVKSAKEVGDETFPEDAIVIFDTVITSVRKDRDGDILQSKGATLVEEMPLLFGHDWDKPIGVMMKVLDHTSKLITARFAIADTDLGRDCAKLLRMGALSVSHGFLPEEFEPIEEKDGSISGFNIKTFEIYETSLVTVPSNVDAKPFANVAKELESDFAKKWAKSFAKRLQVREDAKVPASTKSLSYVTPDALPGSYEAKQSMIHKAFCEKVADELNTWDFYPFRIATFDAKCIMGVHEYGKDDDLVYETSWSEKDGVVSFGDLKEVKVEVSIATKAKQASEGFRKQLEKEAATAETTEEPVAETETPEVETPAEPVAEVTEPEAEVETEQPEATPEVEAAADQEPEPEPANTEPEETDEILALFE